MMTRLWKHVSFVVTLFGAVAFCEATEALQKPESAEALAWRFGLTQVYQQNVRGGASTKSRHGRYAGSYAFEGEVDLEALAGATGADFYVLVEGGWPNVGSIDSPAVGSYFGVNADAVEGEWGELSELWFEQSLLDRGLLVRFGKVDLTGSFECRGCEASFDGNRYANDETAQFLNGALVNNPTIPFPDRTFGLALFGSLAQAWHMGLAVAMGDDEDTSWGSVDEGLFAIVEGSFLPERRWGGAVAQAQYRVGAWCRTDETRDSEQQRGAYVSVSQPIWRGNEDCDSGHGLSLFARAGWADGPGAELADFWSFGVQYQGLWNARADDVLGLGLARGDFVRSADPGATVGSETVWELYYDVSLSSAVALSPSVQYVVDPGGDAGSDDALILALRLQITLE